MAPVTSELFGINTICVLSVSGACATTPTHGFPVAALLDGESPPPLSSEETPSRYSSKTSAFVAQF